MKYIQVMAVLIRETPALDTGELEIGEESQEKAACRQTGRPWAKERSQRFWLGGAALVSMMEFPQLGQLPQCGRSLVPQLVLTLARLCSMPSACVTSRNIQNSFAERGATNSHCRR